MPTRERLTERQQQVLDFIQAKIHRDGYPPTIREIGQLFEMFPLSLAGLGEMVEHMRMPPRSVRRARIGQVLRERE